MSGRRPTARSTRSTPAARRTPRCSARGSSRSRTPPPRRSSMSRTRPRQPLYEQLHPVARHHGCRARPRRRRRRVQRELGGARVRDVEWRHADGRRDRGRRDPGGGSAPAFPVVVDRFLPVAGIARDASLAPDAGTIAWKPDAAVKVAGSPSTVADPCVMRSAPGCPRPARTPRSAAPTWRRFCPGRGRPRRRGSCPTGRRAARAARPCRQSPARLTAKALAATRGVRVEVQVSGPGKVPIKGTVPARCLGRRESPSSWRLGRASLSRGTVTIRLRLNAVGRKRVRRGSRARGSPCASCMARAARRRGGQAAIAGAAPRETE